MVLGDQGTGLLDLPVAKAEFFPDPFEFDPGVHG
jgi:hypothetical protein